MDLAVGKVLPGGFSVVQFLESIVIRHTRFAVSKHQCLSYEIEATLRDDLIERRHFRYGTRIVARSCFASSVAGSGGAVDCELGGRKERSINRRATSGRSTSKTTTN
mmetsp:Transcript_3464/g.9704  ORF Transcript_3464/g.9704 Transcript_3464/m.9704 type:complete len:107 (-) Transcript_3464:149-469(-)